MNHHPINHSSSHQCVLIDPFVDTEKERMVLLLCEGIFEFHEWMSMSPALLFRVDVIDWWISQNKFEDQTRTRAKRARALSTGSSHQEFGTSQRRYLQQSNVRKEGHRRVFRDKVPKQNPQIQILCLVLSSKHGKFLVCKNLHASSIAEPFYECYNTIRQSFRFHDRIIRGRKHDNKKESDIKVTEELRSACRQR